MQAITLNFQVLVALLLVFEKEAGQLIAYRGGTSDRKEQLNRKKFMYSRLYLDQNELVELRNKKKMKSPTLSNLDSLYEHPICRKTHK
mmetsp:Transcript_23566/g.49566  ORF Transcript_23566/g.49566 Transcript_23566/m.49566 type:complete len:88 (-) Transcript_23566:1988-2251(-)